MGREGRLAGAAAGAARILAEYALCDACLGRMYARRLGLRSQERLGGRLRAAARGAGWRGRAPRGGDAPAGASRCYICRGLLASLGPYAERMAGRAAAYEFSTAMVGVTPRPSMAERDDEVRSRFGLAGAPPLRAALSAALSSALEGAAACRIDRSRPDLVLTVNLREDSVEARSRTVVVRGRYTKSARGLPQKQGPCGRCAGRGCGECGFAGIRRGGRASVESALSGFLCGALGARRARMTWVGGEGMDSLVSGPGRPFYASIADPARRGAALPRHADLGPVAVACLEEAESVPSAPVQFSTVLEMSLRVDRPVSDAEIGSVASAMGAGSAAVYGGAGGGRSERALGPAECRRESPDSFALRVEAEGGVPLRELAAGETVFPNASAVLGAECRIERLDILDVSVAGGGGGPQGGGGPSTHGRARARRAPKGSMSAIQ